MGEDGLHPRAFYHLSDQVLKGIAEVLNRAESSGEWPSLVTTNLVHMIPKPTGGRRPIGVMATLVRIYERVRRGIVVDWRVLHDNGCNFMVGGKSASDAVWQQSVRDEAAQEEGIVSASVLLDLIKAFECVRLDVVWKAAERLRFPLVILRLALQAYCKARRLLYRGIVGEEIISQNAILAGGGFATDMLSLLLSSTIDLIRQELPSVHLYVVVDDLTIRVEGQAGEAARQLVRLTALCISELEDNLDMKISRGAKWQIPDEVKSVAVSSSKVTRKSMATGLRALGVPVKGQVRNLGIDYAPGKRARKRVVLLSRWKQVKKKAKRCRMIGTTAATEVGRSALIPAVTYGAACASTATGFMNDLRGVMAELGGPMKGRSTTARLALSGTDPAFHLVLGPLQAWWKAVWEESLPREVLEAALRRAARNARNAGHLAHACAEGGAGAFISSMSRIGWRAVAIDRYITSKGVTFSLGQNCDPKMLFRLAYADLEVSLAVYSDLSSTLTSIEEADGFHRASSSASGFIPLGCLPGSVEQAQQQWWSQYQHVDGRLVPWLKPAIDALNAARRRGCEPSAVSSFRALVEGGWWTQARLHRAGKASDPFCKTCGVQHGTLWHRIAGRCEQGGAPWAEAEEAIRQKGKERWWDPLFSRSIPAMPLMPAMPTARTHVFPSGAEETVITGNIFTDGALRGTLLQARRAGWAFAMIDPSTLQLVVAFFGSCASLWQSVLRAELQAIDEALSRAVAPAVIYTDSGVAVAAFSKGRKYCCSSKSEGAEIWRRIWWRLRDFGSFDLRKVKAHTTAHDVAEGFISADKQAGNAAADFFAVQARKLAQQEAPVTDFEAHYARARAWYGLAFRAIGAWKQDTLADVTEEEARQVSVQRPPVQLAPEYDRHEVWEARGGLLCRACGKRFARQADPASIARRRCEGALGARLLSSMGFAPIYSRYAHTVAELLRAGARKAEVPTRLTSTTLSPAECISDSPAAPPALVRRRVTGKQPDPSGTRSVFKEDTTGHLLVSRGRLTFCDRCGRWALDRLSKALARPCTGSVDTVLGAYRVRRERMRQGKHPMTGEIIRCIE